MCNLRYDSLYMVFRLDKTSGVTTITNIIKIIIYFFFYNILSMSVSLSDSLHMI